MSLKSFSLATLLTLSALAAQAQDAEPARDARQAHARKLQQCRLEARRQRLDGEEARSFVAHCVKQ